MVRRSCETTQRILRELSFLAAAVPQVNEAFVVEVRVPTYDSGRNVKLCDPNVSWDDILGGPVVLSVDELRAPQAKDGALNSRRGAGGD